MRKSPASVAGWLTALLLALTPGLAVTAAKADNVAFEPRLEDGRVPAKMRLIRVRQGDVVRLRWRSDRPIALHLHGYDVEIKVEPGKIAEMSFTAHAAGRFSVEEIRPKAAGGHTHEAHIVRIEVHPR